MHGGATFDWRSLGKADYAQASALVASLPQPTRAKLDGVSREILCRIIHLAWRCAEGSGTGAAYCYPKLLTLAKHVSRSTRTVQRCLAKLKDLGLITWRHRVTASGDNTSNLYTIGKTLLASLFARKGRKTSTKPATTKMAYNDLKKEYKASAPIQKGERLTDYLAKHRADQKQPLGEATFDSAADGWGEEMVEIQWKPKRERVYRQLATAESEGGW